MTDKKSRYLVLDSFRALAALFVVFFHYFHRWVNIPASERLIPETPILSSSNFVAHGFLGVEFFFIISGFVIAMTLTSTKSFIDFAVKRFARLFPAMLACSLTTFFVVSILKVEPLSDVKWLDFVPSLTFISPQVINKLFGLDTDWVSGVYWSLFVEVKFYFYAALVYFAYPKQFLKYFFLLATLMCTIFWLAVGCDVKLVENLFGLVFFPKYAFLFVAGLAFHELSRSDSTGKTETIGILFISLAYSLIVYSPLNVLGPTTHLSYVFIAAFFALFFLFVTKSKLLTPLQSPWLAKVGAASYSLYLLHESIGVSIVNRVNQYFGDAIYWPFVTIGAIILLSIVFYDYIESPARRLIWNFAKSKKLTS